MTAQDSSKTPSAPEAEQALVSCVLQQPGLLPEVTADGISPASFDDLRHRRLWEVLAAMHGAGAAIDIVTILGKLKDESWFIATGGITWLSAIADYAPSPSNWSYYAPALLEAAERRNTIRICSALLNRTRNHAGTIDELRYANAADLATLLQEANGADKGLWLSLVEAGAWFDPKNPPPDEPTLIEIAGVSCATPGNITGFTAQKKAAKSSYMGAINSACISDHGDTLGVKAFNTDHKPTLHFDTEQSRGDHWKLCNNILRRAQLTESVLFKSACLTGFPILDRQRIVFATVRKQYEQTGVFCTSIDGVGDLVRSVNDDAECADFIAALHALAIETRCHIYATLHLNPGSDFKSRGHLGSELERKAQTNLRIERDEDGTFSVWADANRGAPIPRNVGPRFAWSNEAGMFLSIENRASAKDTLKMDKLRDLAESAFEGHPARSRSDLEAGVMKREGCKDSTAYRRLAEMIRLGVITKSTGGLYVVAP